MRADVIHVTSFVIHWYIQLNQPWIVNWPWTSAEWQWLEYHGYIAGRVMDVELYVPQKAAKWSNFANVNKRYESTGNKWSDCRKLRAPLFTNRDEQLTTMNWDINKELHAFCANVITHPCPNFNGGTYKPSLKLGQEWVILSMYFLLWYDYLSIPSSWCWLS